MPGDDFHKTTIDDLSTRLPELATWYGLVASPVDPGAVPVVLVETMGVVDSLTYAREFVLASEPLSRYSSLADDDDDAWDMRWLQSAGESWEAVAEPLLDTPTVGTVAVVLVALQRLAVEVGREWAAVGFGVEDLEALWGEATAGTETLSTLAGWVIRRWSALPDARDLALSPGRVLDLSISTDDGVSAAKTLAYAIADIAVAAGTYSYAFTALYPELAQERHRSRQARDLSPESEAASFYSAGTEEPF